MGKEELKNKILGEYEKGNIVVASFNGLAVVNLEEFIKQPTEGILYDLNRLPEVILSWLEDRKWINDYAVAAVIGKLKQKIAALENKEANLHLTTAKTCNCQSPTASV